MFTGVPNYACIIGHFIARTANCNDQWDWCTLRGPMNQV
jgi:hypothetical protein